MRGIGREASVILLDDRVEQRCKESVGLCIGGIETDAGIEVLYSWNKIPGLYIDRPFLEQDPWIIDRPLLEPLLLEQDS